VAPELLGAVALRREEEPVTVVGEEKPEAINICGPG